MIAGDGQGTRSNEAADGTIAGNNPIFGGSVGELWGDSDDLYYVDSVGKVRTISFSTNRIGTIAGGGNVTYTSKTFLLGTRFFFRGHSITICGDDANGILYIGAGDLVYLFLKSTGEMKTIAGGGGSDGSHPVLPFNMYFFYLLAVRYDPIDNCLYIAGGTNLVWKLDLSPGGMGRAHYRR
jgi:hypothetical protein